MNSLAGYEVMFKNPEQSPKIKNVLVIGAGPAGLEAARTARSLGHNVALYDKASCIGGQINAAWIPPGRDELRNLIEYYDENLKEIGVELHLGEKLTPEKIMNLNPDQVFFATGVYPNKPPIPGLDGSKGSDICFADDALMGDHPIGKKVVILGGAATGVETAIWAAKKGAMDPNVARFLSFYNALPIEEAMKRTYRGDREVHIVEMLPKIATSVGKSTRWMFLDELEKLGVHVHINAKITDLDHNTITFLIENVSQKIENVDTFINATGVKPNRDLYAQFKTYLEQLPKSESSIDIQLLGDAKKVGNILDAVSSGFRAAWKLGKAPNH
jgi:2,4-dienoyl-CoA reductase (NADPH2)